MQNYEFQLKEDTTEIEVSRNQRKSQVFTQFTKRSNTLATNNLDLSFIIPPQILVDKGWRNIGFLPNECLEVEV